MLLSIIKNTNLLLAFLLELGVLAALGYFGFVVGPGLPLKLLLGLGLPVLAIAVWWLFGAPNSIWHLMGIWRVFLQIIFFGSAAVALFASGQRVLGVIFALLFVINIALVYGLGGEPGQANL